MEEQSGNDFNKIDNLQNTDNKPETKNKEDKMLSRINFWFKSACVLFLCSVLAVLSLSSKKEASKEKSDENKGAIVALHSSISKKNKDGIAVVRIYGAISQSMKNYDWERSGSSSIASKIRKMGKKKNVKAIVLDINSPGGTVGAVQEIYDAVKYVRKEYKKPVIASFGDVSASGGYYVASACDEIFAHAGTLTGSIGVIMSGGNMEGLLKKIGYKPETIKSGKYKDIGSSFREMTPEERKILQDMIDDSYQQFASAVAEGRKLDIKRVYELADGRIYTGRQAKEVGLVDKLGNYQDALDRAGELTGLGSNPYIIGSSETLDDVFSMFSSRFAGKNIFSEALDLTPRLEYRLYMK